MSIINNDNFDRDTKLDPAPLNTKFTDVTTGTTSIDENNVRNSGVDVAQFDSVVVVPGGVKAGIQLVDLEHGALADDTGIMIPFTPNDNTLNPVTLSYTIGPTTYDSITFATTLLEGDLIRVYWYTTTEKFVADVGAEHEMWAMWLKWNLFGAGLTEVPGQSDFTTGIGGTAYHGNTVDQCYGTSFIHHISIIDDGSSAANTAPADAVINPLTNPESFIINDRFVLLTAGKTQLMSVGTWEHQATAGEAGTGTISFKLVCGGLVAPYYNAATDTNFLVIDHTQAANTAVRVFSTYMVVTVMRSK